MNLHVWHQIRYAYDQAVILNPQTLYLYPNTYPHQRLLDYSLTIEPKPSKLVQNVDVEGNVQQIAYFNAPTDHLRLTARMRMQSRPVNAFDFVLLPVFDTERVPFKYPKPVQALLAPYLVRDEVTPRLEAWARMLAAGVSWQTVPFLTALNGAIRQFTYQTRDTGAPLPPEQTLTSRCGSCRDYATLYMAACRSMGLAARFVSGYLFGSIQQDHQLHAWAEVYLPGAGWRGFDPTENLVVGHKHIGLASSANAELTTPVNGLFTANVGSVLTAEVRIKSGKLTYSETGAPETVWQ